MSSGKCSGARDRVSAGVSATASPREVLKREKGRMPVMSPASHSMIFLGPPGRSRVRLMRPVSTTSSPKDPDAQSSPFRTT